MIEGFAFAGFFVGFGELHVGGGAEIFFAQYLGSEAESANKERGLVARDASGGDGAQDVGQGDLDGAKVFEERKFEARVVSGRRELALDLGTLQHAEMEVTIVATLE